MKVIVTGATGFLGQHVVERLKAMGFEPFALGRNLKIGSKLESQGIRFIKTDLRNAQEVKNAFQQVKNPDFVIHAAALSSPWGSYQDFFSANVLATENILQECQELDVKRLVHISTPSLYFDYQPRLLVKESDPLPKKMVNSYAETKKIAEELVLGSKVDSIILRPRGIFGPKDETLFPRILRAANKLPFIDDGQALMDITYVENVVDAIMLSLVAKTSSTACYNISNGEPMRFADIIEKLFGKLQIGYRPKKISFRKAYIFACLSEWVYKLFPGYEPPITRYGVGLLAKSVTLDISKAKKELGYTPKISIEEGLELFANWWRAL